jgi:sugar/nucleoside kinase (ribokinase family)
MGEDVEKAIRYGNAAGAIAASRFGSQASLCTMKELSGFLTKQGEKQ